MPTICFLFALFWTGVTGLFVASAMDDGRGGAGLVDSPAWLTYGIFVPICMYELAALVGTRLRSNRASGIGLTAWATFGLILYAIAGALVLKSRA